MMRSYTIGSCRQGESKDDIVSSQVLCECDVRVISRGYWKSTVADLVLIDDMS